MTETKDENFRVTGDASQRQYFCKACGCVCDVIDEPLPPLPPLKPLPLDEHSNPIVWQVGLSYFVRTVTNFFTGRLIAVTAQELVLEEAAWIAWTKRWADTLRTGELDEVEPYPNQVIVGRGAIVDACEWIHPLPRKQQ
jgi:hypothetical protein